MNIFNDFRKQIIDVIEGLGDDSILPEGLNLSRVAVDVPRDAAYGDLSTNAAMVLDCGNCWPWVYKYQARRRSMATLSGHDIAVWQSLR